MVTMLEHTQEDNAGKCILPFLIVSLLPSICPYVWSVMTDMFLTKQINAQGWKSTNAKFKGVPPAIWPMYARSVDLGFPFKMANATPSAPSIIVMHVLMKINVKLVPKVFFWMKLKPSATMDNSKTLIVHPCTLIVNFVTRLSVCNALMAMLSAILMGNVVKPLSKIWWGASNI